MDAQNRVLISTVSCWSNGKKCHLQPTFDTKVINVVVSAIKNGRNCHMKNFKNLISEALCNQNLLVKWKKLPFATNT